MNAKRASRMFNDNPVKPLDAAVYWIEYVARHGGAAHLRTAAGELYWFQRYLLDVVIVVFAVWLAAAHAALKLFACCGKCMKSRVNDVNGKTRDPTAGVRIKTD